MGNYFENKDLLLKYEVKYGFKIMNYSSKYHSRIESCMYFVCHHHRQIFINIFFYKQDFSISNPLFKYFKVEKLCYDF